MSRYCLLFIWRICYQAIGKAETAYLFGKLNGTDLVHFPRKRVSVMCFYGWLGSFSFGAQIMVRDVVHLTDDSNTQVLPH